MCRLRYTNTRGRNLAEIGQVSKNREKHVYRKQNNTDKQKTVIH